MDAYTGDRRRVAGQLGKLLPAVTGPQPQRAVGATDE
jgi:hypothetical protein